jgi:peptidoglycan/LPS O-acetylase OafA/YrhL
MQKKPTLDFLDGYRGFLANTVLLAHTGQQLGLGMISPTMQPVLNKASYHFAVMGFFVLSAFLLTYRLMIDLYNAKSAQACIIKIAQYAMRRFFRIYLVFAIIWTLIHLCPFVFSGYYVLNAYADYADGLSLSYVGKNHLWTIPPEIKYYFFIPIICIFSVKYGRYWTIIWLLSSSLIVYIDIVNPFSFPSEFSFDEGLSSRFLLFFAGSQLAILFFYLEKQTTLREYLNGTNTMKYVLSMSLNILFVAQFPLFKDFSDKNGVISAKYQALLIFILLYVDKANSITRLLNSYYLRTCGRYSFGIYLLHPIIIQAFREVARISSDYIPKPYHTYAFGFALTKVPIVVGLTYFVASIWFKMLENRLIRSANNLSKSIDLNFNNDVVKHNTGTVSRV